MKKDEICKNPVEATYRVIDGEVVRVSAKYVDVPADVIARFLIQRFGLDAIFKGEAGA